MINLENLKNDIILQDGIKYFDFAASALALKSVENEILRILQTYANTHSKTSSNSITTQNYYENARAKFKNLLGVDDKFSLISCGFGATWALKKLWEILGIYIPPMSLKRLNLKKESLKNLPLVIVSPYEHHSNEIPLRYCLCEVVRIPLNSQGLIDFDFLANLLKTNKGREIIASFSMASNLTGIKTDYKKLYLMIKSHGGRLILDACAFAPHDEIDFNFCDAAVFSSHKFLGGIGGSGILVIKNSLFSCDEPTFGGGGTLAYSDNETQRFYIDPERAQEAGTPGVTQFLRSYLAYKFRHDFGIENIKSYENELSEYFLNEISKIDEIEIYGNLQVPRVPIFAINLKGLDPFIFAEILSKKYIIQVRAGCACAGSYGRDLLNLPNDINLSIKPAFLRISLNFSHSKDDIDYLINSIKNIEKNKDKIKLVGGEYRC